MVRRAIVVGAACAQAALLCGVLATLAGWTATAIAFGVTAVIVAVAAAAATVAVVIVRTGREFEGMADALADETVRTSGLKAQNALLARHLAGARERIRELDTVLAEALRGRVPTGIPFRPRPARPAPPGPSTDEPPR